MNSVLFPLWPWNTNLHLVHLQYCEKIIVAWLSQWPVLIKVEHISFCQEKVCLDSPVCSKSFSQSSSAPCWMKITQQETAEERKLITEAKCFYIEMASRASTGPLKWSELFLDFFFFLASLKMSPPSLTVHLFNAQLNHRECNNKTLNKGTRRVKESCIYKALFILQEHLLCSKILKKKYLYMNNPWLMKMGKVLIPTIVIIYLKLIILTVIMWFTGIKSKSTLCIYCNASFWFHVLHFKLSLNWNLIWVINLFPLIDSTGNGQHKSHMR